jgi:threonine dehydrogenase-like Zn-dependent dehydrogenase
MACAVSAATLADPLAYIVHAFHATNLDGMDLPIIGDGPMAAIASVYTR